MEEITIVELGRIAQLPPVQNLIRILLEKNYKVNFIGREINDISRDISQCAMFKSYDVSLYHGNESTLKKIMERIYIAKHAKAILKRCMKTSDILWTTSMLSLCIIGKQTLKYKTIIQLLELSENGYYFSHYIKMPVKKYAQAAWKVVVPEVNRAYIQKVWWDLEKTPIVLPNKPFSIAYGEIPNEVEKAVSIMRQENRKIVLYLGILFGDRNLEDCAKAIAKMDDYALYIVGKIFSEKERCLLDELVRKYGAMYLGAFNPPIHLAFVSYAQIGLLPYRPMKSKTLSSLNALYCAPNKIFEYAGFGVPMVGSDVLGLKFSFEQWNIGRCCDFNDEYSIASAIEEVDRNHDEMSRNCYKFYDSVDLEKIVSEILEDDQ